ncbi:hypothetical protein [Sporosarcina sp. FSL K6-1508]|uniref:hypothetical protein n=1 Tax=Sporosarcina sp. FSL K6-1508 TaxID=2921553 RepID=UPI0030FA7F7B
MRKEEIERVVNENRGEIEKAAVAAGVSVEHLTESVAILTRSFIAVAEAIGKALGILREFGEQVYEGLKENARRDKDRKNKKQRFKIDFKRPEIRHQVTCRKPKFTVRKIIH